MPAVVHALDYLDHPEKHPAKAVCVVFGGEAFLKRQALLQLREAVLGGGDGDFSYTPLEGDEVELRDVLEELATRAMFGGGKRLVAISEADEFVTRYRGKLEDYVAKPKSGGVLVLEVKSFPSNTRLYKAVAATGLAIDCSSPDEGRLARWLTTWAKRTHKVQLPPAAAELLVEMIGPELGLLDQELAKLAVSAGEAAVSVEMVQQMVGTWRARTAWDMLDAALEGRLADALVQLDRLMLAGEIPIAILGQIAASLRRLAAAMRLIQLAEAAGRRLALRDALQQAAAKPLAPFILNKAEKQLRHVGRHRATRLYDWILEADLDLKGDSRLDPRTVLERLLVRIGGPAEAAPVRSQI